MKRAYFFLLPAFLWLACFTAGAQSYYASLGYSTSAPLGETQDFIGKYSWRGVNFEGQWFMQPQVSLGFYSALNVFYEKTSGDFTDDTRTVSGTQLRYLSALPLLLEGRYHLGEEAGRRPYVGLGLGTMRTWQRTEMGILDANTEEWQFGLAPAAGVLIPVGYGTALNLGLRYHYAFQSGDALNNGYLSISVGVAWMD